MRALPAWFVLLAACAASAPDGGDRGAGSVGDERIFFGGTIYVEPSLPPVDALLVGDGRVVAYGELDSVRGAARTDCPELDLEGACVVPGLVDAHGHFAGLGQSLENVELGGSRSFAEVVERVAARAAQAPPGTWITGRGWDQSLWADARFPTHHALSAAVPDHPVLVRRVDGHAAIANARALELAGLLDGDPPQPEGGRVVLDGEGRPTGLLVDTAMGLVGGMVPPPDRAAKRRWLLRAQQRLLSEGLVGVHDMGVDGETAEVLDELARTGELALRVVAYLSTASGEGRSLPPDLAERYPRSSDRDPASRVRVIGAKLYMDGAMGSRGAALLEEYTDAPGEVGLLRMSGTALERQVREVADAGLQPAVHAIGDRANRLVLDAYERVGAELRTLRPRIEHAQLVSPSDRPRFARLGVVPSMQPRHATSDMRWAEARVGRERIAGAYAWQRLGSGSAPLALGSDFPVEPSAPLLGLYAARTRCDEDGVPPGGWLPDQRLDGVEALEGFTRGAAWAAREEDERGLLLPGYFADMTVLSCDPIYDPPAELLRARVLLTVIEGEIAYDGRDG